MILIDIPFPKCCDECPMNNDYRGVCQLTGSDIECMNSEKMDDCPILEFKPKE